MPPKKLKDKKFRHPGCEVQPRPAPDQLDQEPFRGAVQGTQVSQGGQVIDDQDRQPQDGTAQRDLSGHVIRIEGSTMKPDDIGYSPHPLYLLHALIFLEPIPLSKINSS